MKPFQSVDQEYALQCFSYDAETGDLTWRHRSDVPRHVNTRYAGKRAGCRAVCTVGKAYIHVRCGGRLHYAHRVIWVMLNGPISSDIEIDHIDGDGTNNRLANLRAVTRSENKRNMRRLSTNSSGVTGVYEDKRRGTYSARAFIGGKFMTIATGVSLGEAATARAAFNRTNGFHANHGIERPL